MCVEIYQRQMSFFMLWIQWMSEYEVLKWCLICISTAILTSLLHVFFLCTYFLLSIQAEGKARVGVRLLGHLLRGASVQGGVQMEIIEIPLSERPVAMACCSVTGDLLVGCENTLVLFALRGQNQQSLVRVYPLCRLCIDYLNLKTDSYFLNMMQLYNKLFL